MASAPVRKRRRSDRIAAACVMAYRATGALAVVAMILYACVTVVTS